MNSGLTQIEKFELRRRGQLPESGGNDGRALQRNEAQAGEPRDRGQALVGREAP